VASKAADNIRAHAAKADHSKICCCHLKNAYSLENTQR
jgi:hypothetical protein